MMSISHWNDDSRHLNGGSHWSETPTLFPSSVNLSERQPAPHLRPTGLLCFAYPPP